MFTAHSIAVFHSRYMFLNLGLDLGYFEWYLNVGPCHHGMARPRVADGGTASNMEGSCE